MSNEEKIKQDLTAKFPYLENAIKVARQRRIFLESDYNNFAQIFEFAVKQLKFIHLCTITGLDDQDKLGVIYHLSQDGGIMLNVKTSVPKQNPVLKTVIPLFPGAEIYERELVDLFGAKIQGLPEGNRYPLTDDWPTDQFPLRKDWKSSESEKEVGGNA